MSEKKYVKRIGWRVEEKLDGRWYPVVTGKYWNTKKEALKPYEDWFPKEQRRGIARCVKVYVEVQDAKP